MKGSCGANHCVCKGVPKAACSVLKLPHLLFRIPNWGWSLFMSVSHIRHSARGAAGLSPNGRRSTRQSARALPVTASNSILKGGKGEGMEEWRDNAATQFLLLPMPKRLLPQPCSLPNHHILHRSTLDTQRKPHQLPPRGRARWQCAEFPWPTIQKCVGRALRIWMT